LKNFTEKSKGAVKPEIFNLISSQPLFSEINYLKAAERALCHTSVSEWWRLLIGKCRDVR
jgi:hypothetical protein